ncbi:MAG: LysE family transporter [Paracoccaceae bacterium]
MTLAAFLAVALAHLAAAVSPGPSFVVSARMAAAEGMGPALALALGFGLGAAMWATAAMAGLALLFELMPALFAALKLIGGLALLAIGVLMWRHADAPLAMPAPGAAPRGTLSALTFGFATFAMNPKPAVFFGAVFVSLVPVDASLVARAALVAVILVNETLWYAVVARVFSTERFRAAYIRLKSRIDRGFGALIAAFGLRVALF